MSAILKALRRVENESAQGSETLLVSKKLNARKAIRERYKKSWTAQAVLIVLLPLLTLALVLWVVFSYEPFTIPDSSTAAVNLTPFSSKPLVKAKDSVLDDKRKHSEAAPPGSAPAKEEGLQSKASPKKEKKGSPDSTAGQEEGPSVQDPEFKLQAIVWSDVPESRFAVINGVIVRPGGLIEGISVTDIGVDYVSFKSGQRTWKMKMMTK